MPAVTNDSFRKIRLESNAGAVQGIIAADQQLDTLTLVAGVGLSISANESSDRVELSVVGTVSTATLNDILYNGNTSTYGITVDSTLVLDNNSLKVNHATNNLTLGTTGTGYVSIDNTLQTKHLLPVTDITYDLGSSSYRYRDLYLSGSTIYLGSATISAVGSVIDLPSGTTIGGTDLSDSIVPDQTVHADKFLRTNGATLYWDTVPSPFPTQTGNNGKFLKTDGSTITWATVPSTDLTGYATESYVTTAVANLVDSAPTTLNTLNELAAALGDDANYATTITTALGLKAPASNPTLSGTVNIAKSVTPYSIGDFTSHSSYTFSITNSDGGLRFDPSGMWFTLINASAKTIIKGTLQTAWDLSNVTGNQTISMSSLFSGVTLKSGHYWKPDGTAFYVIVSNFGNTVARVNLGTPWDIATITSVTTGGIILFGTPNILHFSPDGTRLYTDNQNGPQIEGYVLPGAWDISDGTHTYKNFITTIPNNWDPDGFDFSPDGSRIFMMANTRVLYVFDLTTPWAIDTIDSVNVVDIVDFTSVTETWYAPSIMWGPDGTFFYLTSTLNGTNFTKVERFDIGISGGTLRVPGTLRVSGAIPSPTFSGVVRLPNGTNEAVWFGPGDQGGFLQSSGNAIDSTLTVGSGGDYSNFASLQLGARRAIVGGILTSTQNTEFFSTKSDVSGVETHNYNSSAIFYHTGLQGAFTANFTNLPTAWWNETIVLTLVISQGSTAYLPGFQIDSSSKTVNWVGGVTPTPNPNKIDVVSFTVFRLNNDWGPVLGSLTTYG